MWDLEFCFRTRPNGRHYSPTRISGAIPKLDIRSPISMGSGGVPSTKKGAEKSPANGFSRIQAACLRRLAASRKTSNIWR